VKKQWWEREGGEQGTDVDVVASAHDFDEVGVGDGDELQVLEPLLIFGGGFFGNVEVRDDLKERGIGFAPIELDEGLESATDVNRVGVTSVVCAARIGTA